MRRLNNRGVTLAETLVAFLIICVGIVMLTGCIVSTINIISSSRAKNDDTQTKVNKFWTMDEHDSSVGIITVRYPDGEGNDSFKVQINSYKVSDDEVYFEYEKIDGVAQGN